MPTPLLTATRHASTPVIERLAWLTDVQVARSGVERRSSQRPFPRHTLGMTVRLGTAAERASLPLLRSGVDMLVPLWQHAFSRPDTSPSAGYQASTGVALLDQRGAITQDVAPVVWPGDASIAAPLALGRLSTESRAIEHAAHRFSTAELEFQLLNYVEAPGAYTGPNSGGLPLLDPFTPTARTFAEGSEFSTNTADPGWADGLLEVRHVKEATSCEIVLNGRAAILSFRRLLFALAGRRNTLRWTPGGVQGAVESTYRLASDIVEIKYLRPGLATCALSLVKL